LKSLKLTELQKQKKKKKKKNSSNKIKNKFRLLFRKIVINKKLNKKKRNKNILLSLLLIDLNAGAALNNSVILITGSSGKIKQLLAVWSVSRPNAKIQQTNIFSNIKKIAFFYQNHSSKAF